MTFTYFDANTSKTGLALLMQENQLKDLLAWEPLVRTKMAIELKELHDKHKVEAPYWLVGFIEDPNRWTEVAVRLDLGTMQDPIDAINEELGTNFADIAEFKASLGIVPIVNEVKASEIEDFVSQALEGEE